jgi:hypothetical protein
MIDDDELLLYRMGEHPDPARIRAALAADPELAARERALAADLAQLSDWTPPGPDAAQQARWQTAVAVAAEASFRPGSDSRAAAARQRARRRRPWALALAASVLLALSFQLGRQTASVPTPAFVTTPAAGEADTRGAWSHLAATRTALAELPAASDRAGRVAALIAHNRLQVVAAERAGDAELARVLRAFEPVLQQLARTAPEADAGVRAQLDFEARTLQTKLRATPSNSLQRL